VLVALEKQLLMGQERNEREEDKEGGKNKGPGRETKRKRGNIQGTRTQEAWKGGVLSCCTKARKRCPFSLLLKLRGFTSLPSMGMSILFIQTKFWRMCVCVVLVPAMCFFICEGKFILPTGWYVLIRD
jgi:hypothetical protein